MSKKTGLLDDDGFDQNLKALDASYFENPSFQPGFFIIKTVLRDTIISPNVSRWGFTRLNKITSFCTLFGGLAPKALRGTLPAPIVFQQRHLKDFPASINQQRKGLGHPIADPRTFQPVDRHDVPYSGVSVNFIY